jgi:hypothetical protein
MKNTLQGFTLEDMLLLIGLTERTGELVLESGNNIGSLLVHQGRILQASSPYSRAIGDLLVEDGVLSETELIETLKLQKRSAYSPLGGLLQKMGRITFEAVEMMVHEQIRRAVTEFRSWDKVNFNFRNKEIAPYDGIHLRVQEFISPDTMKSAKIFFPPVASTPGESATASASSVCA